ncbi:MAG: NAD(P)/FAD-dependent oxidoreductase [Candidatus Saccharibacteria bacterium]|nr:NAD(P)/FAD-dependent oxidoreductase [Candidatus Saccharibacteria bacterium]
MKKRFDYDLVVIGSGDAGSEAALIAAKSGLNVALVEAKKWGGSNLNTTNVPFGAALHAAFTYKQAVAGANYGISSGNLRYNYPTLVNWKNQASKKAGANSKHIFEEAKIECIHGTARFMSKNEIVVGKNTISAGKFLIATGAATADTGIKIPENVDYYLPENALNIPRLPKSVFVVGAGSTGCEVAQYFAALGSEVVIADIAGRLLPREDEEVGQVLDDIFKKDNIKVLTQSRVIALEKDGVDKKVIFMRGGQEKSIKVSTVILCTGSAPNIDLGLDNAGVKYTHDGIKVDKTMQTSVKHIYAAGDITGGHSSTEKAIIDARVAVAHILGKSKLTADYAGLIRVTNTCPEVAQVGISEDDCIRHDRKIKKIIVPLQAVQKSNITNNYNGFVKLIFGKAGTVIGGTVMAPNAGIIAQELAYAVKYEMNATEIANVPHVANDWSELIRTAAERMK